MHAQAYYICQTRAKRPYVRVYELVIRRVDRIKVSTVERLPHTLSDIHDFSKPNTNYNFRHDATLQALAASRALSDEASHDVFAALGQGDCGLVAGEDLESESTKTDNGLITATPMNAEHSQL